MRRLLRHLPVAAALALLALPAPAFASSDQAIRDCAFDEDLDRRYSNKELREAADNLPSDLAEYSDCREVLLGAVSGSSDKSDGAGSPGIGGSDPAGETAAQADDQADLAAVTGGGGDSPRLDVGGTSLEPDSSGFFGLGNAANKVPLPLMIALLLLGAMALASGVGGLRERVPALARIPLLSKLPTPRVPFIGRRS
jgi:hypothetical protein